LTSSNLTTHCKSVPDDGIWNTTDADDLNTFLHYHKQATLSAPWKIANQDCKACPRTDSSQLRCIIPNVPKRQCTPTRRDGRKRPYGRQWHLCVRMFIEAPSHIRWQVRSTTPPWRALRAATVFTSIDSQAILNGTRPSDSPQVHWTLWQPAAAP
jgi:hypothetical protein